MTTALVTFYDYDHCREFLENRARELRETAKGLDTLAIFRELYYSFSFEAMEQGAVVLGQFEPDQVFVFTPEVMQHAEAARHRDVGACKAVELLGCGAPPLVIELLAGQTCDPPVGPKGRINSWMRPEYLNDVILPGRVQVQLYFDGGSFFEGMLAPQLAERGFEVLDDYRKSARTGQLRVRHPGRQGVVYKLPWVAWVREMMGGGYCMVYLAACLANYLQKLQQTVNAEPASKEGRA